jgi:uncharacterized protein YkwD
MPARGSRGSSLAVSVLITVLAVAAAVVLVIRLPGRPAEAAGRAAAGAVPSPASEGVKAVPVTPRPSRSTARPARAHHHHHRPSPGMTPATRPASPGTTAPTTAPPASPPPPAGQSAAAQQVLALINQARAQAGLPAYTISSGLDTSAARHTSVMAGGCGLSHQCPGEPALGARESAAGVAWTAAGENIGEGGPVADTPAAIAQMAAGLTQGMLDEKPPDDGHRLNILSSAFTHIGISVYRDSSGTVWMTQDFSN